MSSSCRLFGCGVLGGMGSASPDINSKLNECSTRVMRACTSGKRDDRLLQGVPQLSSNVFGKVICPKKFAHNFCTYYISKALRLFVHTTFGIKR